VAYLDPSQTGTYQEAQDYLNQIARQRRGSDLTEQEWQQIGTQVPYQQGTPVSGTQVNQALDVMGWGSPAATGVPAPTGGTSQPTTSGVPPQPTAAEPGRGGCAEAQLHRFEAAPRHVVHPLDRAAA